ncbi:hypothetical protein L6164_013265 [Bauhinia variegata]|uniref:Uncharacterized protein n=1 Tax=Bauhinia variegata TaxID=167791 RepID=A0ACB9PC29_BAUVA|nr:hypothetical protein L6164_013265 [Bauhinia variegata]
MNGTHDTTRETPPDYVEEEPHPITSIDQDLSGLQDKGGSEARVDIVEGQPNCDLPNIGSLTGHFELGRGYRTMIPSSRLHDYMTNTVQLLSPSTRSPSPSSSSVAWSSTSIFLSQRKYALDFIQKTGLLGAKPALTPMETNHHLALIDGNYLDNPTKYRHLVGCLIYLCFTRPELSYCVHMLAQFMQQPR